MRRCSWCCVLLAALCLQGCSARSPRLEFPARRLVTPKLYHGKEQEEIPSTLGQDGKHVRHLTVTYNLDGREYVLDLVLNTHLIPESYFEKYQHDDGYVIRTSENEAELCYYHGHVRGVPRSWAAISTCNGTSGAIFDGEEVHYLESGHSQEEDRKLWSGSGEPHFLYRRSDRRDNGTCGTPGKFRETFPGLAPENTNRFKRDVELTWSTVHEPYKADRRSRYVELVLVVSKEVYEARRSYVPNYCKELVNIASRMYSSLNIYIALVGVVIWRKRNEILITAESDKLAQFRDYRKDKLLQDHPNDNAHLILLDEVKAGVVGRATKSAMCSAKLSAGVIADHSPMVGVVAHTLAHEIGHNFGMEHDDENCHCDGHCIMNGVSSNEASYTWSTCSLEYLALAYERGLDYCLHNVPKRLFQGPVCGNGFVEDSEQCDCGMAAACDNPCCNSSTCLLRPAAKCATGKCCDLQTCELKAAGTLCRSAARECDLPEFCTDDSEYCPHDTYKANGEVCRSGQAFCYDSMCRTYDSQCQLLWGPSGRSGPDICYENNQECSPSDDPHCNIRDSLCQLLQCTHADVGMEFGGSGSGYKAITVNMPVGDRSNSVACTHVIMDVAAGEFNEGQVRDGVKCGDRQMCVNQKCVPVNKVRDCASNCSGRGVCNNKGNCHCENGFAPPECDTVGVGGSVDSGPAGHPDGNIQLAMSLYIIFLGIIPLLALVGLTLYIYRRKSNNRDTKISVTQLSGQPMYKPTFFKWRPRISTRSSASEDNVRNKHEDSSTRPEISTLHLMSTTNSTVLSTICVGQNNDSPDKHSAPQTSVVGSGRRLSMRVRKVSLSKGLTLKMAPAQKQVMRNLLEPSDSSGASTPDTPPALRIEAKRAPLDHGGLSVAQLAAQYSANDHQANKESVSVNPLPRKTPKPPPQWKKPHLPC